jgi:hypothetical protein
VENAVRSARVQRPGCAQQNAPGLPPDPLHLFARLPDLLSLLFSSAFAPIKKIGKNSLKMDKHIPPPTCLSVETVCMMTAVDDYCAFLVASGVSCFICALLALLVLML